jgi:mannose-6-phosphate isomerase-like protein (cupin superfamily)
METTLQRVAYLAPGEGKAVHLVGDTYTFKVVGEETDGRFALIEGLVPPEAGPPPHIHHREDECFWVLEGEVEFLDTDRTLLAGSGSCLRIPKGTLHRFKNVGTAPARILFLVSPAGLEKMFEEIGEPATAGSVAPPPQPVDIAKLLAVAPKYGMEIP